MAHRARIEHKPQSFWKAKLCPTLARCKSPQRRCPPAVPAGLYHACGDQKSVFRFQGHSLPENCRLDCITRTDGKQRARPLGSG